MIYPIHATSLAHHNKTGLHDAVIWPSPQKGEEEEEEELYISLMSQFRSLVHVPLQKVLH